MKQLLGIIFVLFRIHLAVIVLTIFTPNVHGQNRPTFKFKQVDIALNNNEVTSIVQDKEGFLWVSTLVGLHRFDGLSYEFYGKYKGEHGLPHPRVIDMLVDSSGRLWIGTYNGLCYYSRKKNHFVKVPFSPVDNEVKNLEIGRITSILEDSQANLWVCSETNGLYIKKANTERFELFPKNITSGAINSMHFQNDSILWLGTTRDGLYRSNLRDNSSEHYPLELNEETGLHISSINGILSVNDRYLFISGDFGVDRLDLASSKFFHFDLQPSTHGRILLDSKDRLWIAVENNGLLLYDESIDGFYNYKNDPKDPYSAPSISYWDIYEDMDQRIWLGSTLDGLSVIDENIYKFELYNSTNRLGYGLSSDIVRSILEDEVGNFYIATDGGGLHYYNRTDHTYQNWRYDAKSPNSLGSDAVFGMCFSDDGKLWLGTWQGGLNIFDPKTKTFSKFRADNEDLLRSICVLKTNNGEMWIGTNQGGLARYIPQYDSLISYHHIKDDSSSINGESAYVLLEDKDQNIWIGTSDAGVNVLKYEDRDSGKFKSLVHDPNDPQSLVDNQISHIMEDSDGNVWIATANGLSKYLPSSGKFTNYDKSQGLASIYLKAIVEDNEGYLWVSSTRGLSKFDKATETFKNYNRADGVQDDEFSRFCGMKTSRGELVFGGTNGFNVFDPKTIKDDPHKPQVYLSGFKIFNKEVEIDDESGILTSHISVQKEIILSHLQSIFTLEYVGVSFNYPEKNSYAYRLKGLEENWNYVGDKKTATYTNLDPGTYEFQVKASNHDDLWNEQGASLTIHILSPWWKTWWAYLIFVSIIIIGIYILIYIRTSYLSEQKRLLARQVKERTNELTQKNFRIENQAEKLHYYNTELNAVNQKLTANNESLEEKVRKRTNQLLIRNQLLAEYAFANAHNLRVPVANIKGIIQLLEGQSSIEEITELISLLKGQSENLDAELKNIQKMLELDKKSHDDESFTEDVKDTPSAN